MMYTRLYGKLNREKWTERLLNMHKITIKICIIGKIIGKVLFLKRGYAMMMTRKTSIQFARFAKAERINKYKTRRILQNGYLAKKDPLPVDP